MPKYLFSESARLLCELKGKYKLLVINGGWTGMYKDGQLTVDDCPETKIKIDDWVEIDPKSMPRDWQEQWYYKRLTHRWW